MTFRMSHFMMALAAAVFLTTFAILESVLSDKEQSLIQKHHDQTLDRIWRQFENEFLVLLEKSVLEIENFENLVLTNDLNASEFSSYSDLRNLSFLAVYRPLEKTPVLSFGDNLQNGMPLLSDYKTWQLEKDKRSYYLSYQLETMSENQKTVTVKGGLSLSGFNERLLQLLNRTEALAVALVQDDKLISKASKARDIMVNFDFLSSGQPRSGDLAAYPDLLYKSAQIDFLKAPDELRFVMIATKPDAPLGLQYLDDYSSKVYGVVFIILALLLSTMAVLFKRKVDYFNEIANAYEDGGASNAISKKSILKEANQIRESIEKTLNHLLYRIKGFEGIVQNSNNPIVSWDKTGRITVFNASAEQIFNVRKDDILHTQILEFIFERKDHKAAKAFEMVSKGIKPDDFFSNITVDGQQRFFLWKLSPVLDEQGTIVLGLAEALDISDQVAAERRLRLATQIFDHTAEAILITDDKADIVDVNSAFTDITGYERSEVIGRNPRLMKSGRHSERFYERMWKQIHDKGIWRGEVWDKRKDGSEYPKHLSISAIRNNKGVVTNYIGVFSDITDRKNDQEKLIQLAHFDPLTGLPNRTLFEDRLYTALARCKREEGMLAILFVDLDRFKQINDTFGHRVGDSLLVEVSKRLKHSVREVDTVARLSGDEFTCILTDVTDRSDAEYVAGRIVKSLGMPYFFEGNELFISASVGIAISPEDGDKSIDLLRHADVAMYSAKEKGKNTYQFFDKSMNDGVESHLSLANQLRIALNRDKIKPHYQLKVDTSTGRPIGVEALARWFDDYNNPISPELFIPVAEDQGLIVRVGGAILVACCAQARMWQDMKFDFGRIAINLSAQQFRDKNLLSDIQTAIEDHKIAPDCLEVEVTENMMMEDVQGAIQILNSLKEMGLKIAIDDFGTGYSSLNYLKRFPVDALKIDKSFVQELTLDSDDAAIVSAIVSMSQKLGIDVVAEGVETEEQLAFLTDIGCKTVQGYFFAKPCNGAELPIIWNDVLDKFSNY